ncbi:NAD(P)/FAD-dependent oxidoreductase [Thalassospira alkalitolerans]|uniref:FAD-dependent oxidoreductase n=1 Tax=Thalassospira alkalitolerans TaxID=1293890 RepID=A0A1Y2LC92_9PROT|nr:FAD-binding oxidoreductase [Thalassospira alkalitolerans]OSQ48399.1 FAD-dependent oxidoreductase [Thalassospira alkalitolerans]
MTNYPKIELPKECDVVVIGGGIHGSSSAYYLSKSGMKVVLLEKDTIASHQSGRAWGFVRQQGRDPVELPLMIECNRIWQGLEKELNADLEWRQGGVLFVARDDGEMADYEQWIEDAKGFGIETQVLDPKGVGKVAPGITAPGVGGIFTPSDGQAEPKKAAAAIAKRASELGAVIAEGCGAIGIETSGGAISSVVSERGEIKCKYVICAAGAATHKFVAKFGRRLPQQTTRGTVIRTTPVTPITAAGTLAEGLAFRQRADGSLNIADEFMTDLDLTLGRFKFAKDFMPGLKDNWATFKFHLNKRFIDDLVDRMPGSEASRQPMIGRRENQAQPYDVRVKNAMANLQKVFPQIAKVDIVDSWAGDIDVTPDAVPVIDQFDNPKHFFVATGFSGHGFAMGPVVGKVLADWITTGQPSITLAGMELARFEDGSVRRPRTRV